MDNFKFLAVCLTLATSFSVAFSDARCTKRPTIENGFVRIRSRGRIAKFKCNPGYSMYGESFVACLNGRWEYPLPVCVTGRGCPPLSKVIFYGEVNYLNAGGIMKFKCNPGLKLVGTSMLYCNGKRWSSSIPYCISKAGEASECDFEKEPCSWGNLKSSDGGWLRGQDRTPTSILGTGPDHDHTLPPSKHGHYLFLESSLVPEGGRIRLQSPIFPPVKDNGTCFRFWYHMYGATTGILNVYVNDALVFTKQGQQGKRWFKGRLFDLPTDTSFKIEIEGVRGPGYTGDIAIDDLAITNGTDCETDTDYTSCNERCDENVTMDATICHCHADCAINETCCHDYNEFCTAIGETDFLAAEKPKESTEKTGTLVLGIVGAVLLVVCGGLGLAWWARGRSQTPSQWRERLFAAAAWGRSPRTLSRTRRRGEDDAMDVLFLSADEALDFGLAQPHHQVVESVR